MEKLEQLIKNIIRIPQFGLMTDLDGTISQIVDHPEMAIVKPEISTIITELVEALPVVAIISGRSVDDIRQRVGIPGVVYIGNHGLEHYVNGKVIIKKEVAQFRSAIKEAYEEIFAILSPGMLLEDKNITLSLHYRMVENPDKVRIHLFPVIKKIGEKYDLLTSEGRMVIELRPPIQINKGTAINEVIRDFSLHATFFLGDDITDVAAMKEAIRIRKSGKCLSFGIGVISEGMSKEVRETADYLVPGVEGVERLLELLLKSRRASST